MNITNNRAEPSLPINISHVSIQFSRRKGLTNSQFLYNEIANRLANNLKYIKIKPKNIVDSGCGIGNNIPVLQSIYKNFNYIGIDRSFPLLSIGYKKWGQQGILNKIKNLLTNKSIPRFIQSDMSKSGLKPKSVDIVWSNLALHWHNKPKDVLNDWYRILTDNGLVIFSYFGPDTIKEVRLAVTDANIKTGMMSFIDMHDIGDMLMHSGFENPVMQKDTITLTYKTPLQLLKDVHYIGGNANTNRKKSFTSKEWLNNLCESLEKQRNGSSINLTIEIIYGHAWRKTNHNNSNEKIIKLDL
ncbi:biotin synthesis protein BioC [Candidatus Kinetoplastibacterium blastocrithidii TCC012E]|uniref:Biotin synthesis protein BioC n=1 Tax=Candidatus Kinetoplastidibacterium blastocrithidiae TCC012E TaxID=1208922 RepID=M1M4P1_9PROT|nr:methyltransferase domain-containing protein [Candidatus Kinetoplastibacterium blastocrithidii]AFZ83245.1 malonyl-CoA O-methyltransferase [Candidatus Kinetoplastibacterium blastocrithidii (ex Strigomonas culicis)]AGF50059.1 biotin synthesis protein BioC [Candidatus Kinetoplastibacterium blastocrithidii TCC012E]